MRSVGLASIAAALLAAALLAAGCGEDSRAGGARSAVATTGQAADLLRNVGGERLEVTTIVETGADPHGYEPRPSDVAAIAEALLVVRSGGDLDEWLDELIDNAGGEAEQLTLIDSVETIGGEQTDPHWWQDPSNAVLAVRAIERALAEADPGGRSTYARNADAYVRRLEQLDRRIAACLQRVPAARRKLVTTHDALGYYAERYGLEVLGSVIPALSTQAQPSAREVEELVERIRAERVEAIFPEAELSQRLERAISREAGVDIGGALWADTLGPEGSEAETYLGAMAANTATLVEGLSGGAASCRPDAGPA